MFGGCDSESLPYPVARCLLWWAARIPTRVFERIIVHIIIIMLISMIVIVVIITTIITVLFVAAVVQGLRHEAEGHRDLRA